MSYGQPCTGKYQDECGYNLNCMIDQAYGYSECKCKQHYFWNSSANQCGINKAF